MRRRKVALLGAGGWIGQHFVRLLAEHPFFEDPILGGGGRTSGKKLEDLWLLPEEGPPPSLARKKLVSLTPGSLAKEGVEVVFSALRTEEAATFETQLAQRGIAVFSTTPAHRMGERVPLVVPEVNGVHLDILKWRKEKGFLVTNSNCVTAGLVIALKPLLPLLKPKQVNVTTYQALSGAGFPGVASLSMCDNVLPYIEHEEEKLEVESRKILGTMNRRGFLPFNLHVYANCARVSTREGHLEAVSVEAKSEVSPEEIRKAWTGFHPIADAEGSSLPTAPEAPIIYRKEEDRPQPLMDRWAGSPTRARGMAVTVGRLRVRDNKVMFYLLVHNAVRGGAGGSILTAELSVKKAILGGQD
jgi:aspartate-semialdehyde dehydrogenase